LRWSACFPLAERYAYAPSAGGDRLNARRHGSGCGQTREHPRSTQVCSASRARARPMPTKASTRPCPATCSTDSRTAVGCPVRALRPLPGRGRRRGRIVAQAGQHGVRNGAKNRMTPEERVQYEQAGQRPRSADARGDDGGRETSR
jgi:hypothetical protein